MIADLTSFVLQLQHLRQLHPLKQQVPHLQPLVRMVVLRYHVWSGAAIPIALHVQAMTWKSTE